MLDNILTVGESAKEQAAWPLSHTGGLLKEAGGGGSVRNSGVADFARRSSGNMSAARTVLQLVTGASKKLN